MSHFHRRPPFAPLDLVLAAGLSLVAALIRWPMLQLVPRFTDEWQDVQLALNIARGDILPVVKPDSSYFGPLLHYLMAPGFLLGGGLEWPRELVWLLGSLTVGLTYFLGVSVARCQWGKEGDPGGIGDTEDIGGARDIGDPLDIDAAAWWTAARWSGIVAALLMAVSFIPVVVNSHIAWSNASTPFWTTLFLLAVVESHRRNWPPGLLLAGLLAGLAQQTHPSVIAILIGGAIWTLWMRPAWLKTRWPWLGLAVAALAVSNLALYNLWSGGGSVASAAERDYAFTGGATWPDYLVNARSFVRMAYQLVSSTFLATINEEAEPMALAAALRGPGAVLYGLVALAALAYTARRAGIALACWMVALILLPYFNRGYHHFILGRYLAALLPPTFAAMGCLLVGIPRRGARRRLGQDLGRPGMDRPGTDRPGVVRHRLDRFAVPATRILTLVLTLCLLAYPLHRLQAFYAAENEAGRTNARLWQIVRGLDGVATEADPVYLDRELRHLRLTAGGNLLLVLDSMMDLQDMPHVKVKQSEQLELPAGAIIVLSQGQADALGQGRRLDPVDLGAPLVPAAPGEYGVYRLGP